MRLFYTLLLSLSISLGLMAQNCLDGYSYLGAYDGHHYYLSNASVHPSEAYAIGASFGPGTYLASIGSAGENAWLAPKVGFYKTIGFSDRDVEGNFVWQSGEAVGYTNWGPTEPNNAYYPNQNMYENYTVINFPCSACGLWNDVPDWTSQRFVLEVEDDDCDGVGNVCDLCPGGDDSVDNNNDGLPDCAYYPGFNNLSPDWICAPNKVLVCHRPPDNPANSHNICISKNAVADHMGHGDYVGPCTDCGNGLQGSGQTGFQTGANGLDPEELTVYPNPASDEVNIRLPEMETDALLSIVDIQGRIVWNRTIPAHGDRTLQIPADLLYTGLFTVIARSEDRTFTQRLVIQR